MPAVGRLWPSIQQTNVRPFKKQQQSIWWQALPKIFHETERYFCILVLLLVFPVFASHYRILLNSLPVFISGADPWNRIGAGSRNFHRNIIYILLPHAFTHIAEEEKSKTRITRGSISISQRESAHPIGNSGPCFAPARPL